MEMDSIQEILLTESQIAARVQQRQGNLRGLSRQRPGPGWHPERRTRFSDLMRQVKIPVNIDFMAVSSYGSASQTSAW